MIEQKRDLRQSALALRKAQRHRSELSRQVMDRVVSLPSFSRSKTVAIYVSTPFEVDTHNLIQHCWNENKQVAVPCCVGDELELFRLISWTELAPRTMGILEPTDKLLSNADRRVACRRIDLFAVPGVAFDPRGGRLGYGKGYYDRLLGRSSNSSLKVGLAFDCQLLEQVPMGPHDVFLDIVVTQTQVHTRSSGAAP